MRARRQLELLTRQAPQSQGERSARAEVLDGVRAAAEAAVKTIAALDTLEPLAASARAAAAAVDYSSTLMELLRQGHLGLQLERLEAVALAQRAQVQAAAEEER